MERRLHRGGRGPRHPRSSSWGHRPVPAAGCDRRGSRRSPRRRQDRLAPILALYELLLRIADNPVVRPNHTVAVAMTRGAAAGLDLLPTLEADKRIAEDHRLHAVHAHLMEMSGDRNGHAAPTKRRPGEPPASHNSATCTPTPTASPTTPEPARPNRRAASLSTRTGCRKVAQLAATRSPHGGR